MSPPSRVLVRAGLFRPSPEVIVGLVGIILVAYALVLFGLTEALPAMELFVPLIALFATFGVLVAHDARRWGRNALAWGIGCLFLGPVLVIFYVWAKWGYMQARVASPPP